MYRRRILPAAMALLVTVAALMPSALALPEHGDEAQYGFTAGYYGAKLSRLDFSPSSTHPALDPGWSPRSYWPLTQPMGARFVYILATGITGAPMPSLPYSPGDPALQGPEARLTQRSLIVLRLAAILCAALGFALVSLRLGWPGLGATALMLAIPHVRDDLARGWAEGPLMLGFGLCTLAYGSRWFAPVCGVAATFKLTALGLWPLAFWHGFGRFRYAHVLGFVVAALVWSALTPPSWFALGPVFLVSMLMTRSAEYSDLSATYSGPFGLFLPTRYLWPIELLAALVLAIVLPRLWHRLHNQQPATAAKNERVGA